MNAPELYFSYFVVIVAVVVVPGPTLEMELKYCGYVMDMLCGKVINLIDSCIVSHAIDPLRIQLWSQDGHT